MHKRLLRKEKKNLFIDQTGFLIGGGGGGMQTKRKLWNQNINFIY